MIVCVLCNEDVTTEDWIDFKSEPFYPIKKIVNGKLREVHEGDKVHARCSLSARREVTRNEI